MRIMSWEGFKSSLKVDKEKNIKPTTAAFKYNTRRSSEEKQALQTECCHTAPQYTNS